MIGSNWWLAYSTRHIIPHTYNQLTVGKRNCTTRCWDFTQRWAHALFFFFALSLFALFRRTLRDSCHHKSAMAWKTARGPTSNFMYFIPGIGKTDLGVPFDFSFTVSYRFPIFKTKKLPKVIKMGGNTHPGEQDPNNPYNNSGGRSSGGSSLRNLRSGGGF